MIGWGAISSEGAKHLVHKLAGMSDGLQPNALPVQGEYPDVMLIAGEPVFYEGRADTVTNPQMIVEVLSKSTRNYDQGDKFDCYRTIPGFLEYVLVDQYQVYVKQFVKTPEGFWLLKEYGERAQKLALSSIQFEIALDEIYEGIQLSET